MKKLFGRDDSGRPANSPTSQIQESESTTETGSRNAPRRELIQVVLRDTMRKHGIPSDWIECRILSVMGRTKMAGMHVQLVVQKGDESLLTYVHAFQNSFRSEIMRFDPNAPDWLLSLCWQFEGNGIESKLMPNPATWTAGAAAATAAASAQEQQDADDVSKDLEALFAIRDAALSSAGDDAVDFQPTQPGEGTESAPRKPR